MPEPIEGQYFNWLRAKVVDFDAPANMYLELLRILYRTEFVWLIIGDKNRLDDGLELRYYFCNEVGCDKEEPWYSSPCSVLEVLIAFADRASFQTDISVKDWFWKFMTNLELDGYQYVIDSDIPDIAQTLERFNFRMYEPSGYGGLFPLREPKNEDQTKVEIWYQFCEYLEDQGMI